MTTPHPAAAATVTSPRRRTALCVAAALMALPVLPACAIEPRPGAQPIEMSVIDRDSGQPLTVYRKAGRAWVAGQPASRYAIRLRNQSGARVLVVLSVDGVNVVSGETAAYGQTGYVLDPGRSHDITGWRKSDTAIAAFEFAALAESYAARTGRPGNVGVIGAAVFLEKPQVPAVAKDGTRAETSKSLPAAPPAPTAAAAAGADNAATPLSRGRLAMSSDRLGTAHGQREWSVSSRTSFERLDSSPQQLVEVAYDSHANLVAAGVIVQPLAQARPRAFPQDETRGFVPDPPLR